MANFWKSLPKPFLVLAPMEDVTDFVFREIIAGLPKPDVFFTEFTSSDALCSSGRDRVIRKLKFSEDQHPIVAQIWEINPKNIFESAKLVQDLGFDGIDINMGCPVPPVINKGAGGALCTNKNLAKEIIDAARSGAPNISLSVKTRLGFDKIETDEWISFLLEQKLHALTVHGRIVTRLSKDPANWEEIGKSVTLKNKIAPDTILIGNGDIRSYQQAIEMHEVYNVDGIMIGRGIFSDPWVFEKTNNPKIHERKEYIDILLKHLRLYINTWEDTKNFEVMKKFFKMYIRDFDGANELRQSLMECKKSTEVEEILAKID